MTPEDRLKKLGLVLPPLRTPLYTYVPSKGDGTTYYLSGQGPLKPDGTHYKGKVGETVSLSDAYQHAKLVGLGLLGVAKSIAVELDRVEIIKVFGMVNATPDFADHPKVINGCSDLLVEVLGERGRHARSAVGMMSLPNHMTVEIEAVIRITK